MSDAKKNKGGRPKKKEVITGLHKRTPHEKWSRDHANLIAQMRTAPGEPVVLPEEPTEKELEESRRGERIRSAQMLRIDPLCEYEDVSLFAIFILFNDAEHEGVPERRKQCREWLANFTMNESPDEVAELFKKIIAMKNWLEIPPHRNFKVYWLYHCFLEEFGFEPTRARLKKFILADSEYAPSMPNKGATEEWRRLWKAAGLMALD